MGTVNVTIGDIDAIVWQKGTECKYEPGDNVDVWRISINQNTGLIPLFMKLLTPDELKRADRYYQAKDKDRFIISRGALRIILSRYIHEPPGAIVFRAGYNKKPFINHTDQKLNHNLSHSDEWVVIAISDTAVGIDTEMIDTLFKYEEILADNFSATEISYIKQEHSAQRFYQLWTRKEAITKLTAQGLDERLIHIPSLNGKHLTGSNIINSSKAIQLTSFKVDEHNLATLASETTSQQVISFWDADLGN